MMQSKYTHSSTEDWVADVGHRLRLDDNRPTDAAMPPASPKMHIKREATTLMMARSSPSRPAQTALTKLRELKPSALLVLFTPVMVPSGFFSGYEGMTKTSQVRNPKLDSDPFEALGLALSKRHRRVRHVPYVPAVGFTETHHVFAMQADAIIVVACQPEHIPTAGNDTKASVSNDAHLAMQSEFALKASDALQEAERHERVPMVAIHFGDDQFPLDVRAYKDVWAGETYNSDTIHQIVQLMFGGKSQSSGGEASQPTRDTSF
ncbi:hypothetical protein M433DRAFT_131425 [Acidomyces richmondensis BFW]|nr:MAG: hypothetical protein FE78DRAFT_513458 [Acidomyces sp. 'richmondensis']KYG49258.1 hypothetical protein M433DRAFT_131425 [Acidomyces richmondensis BFW]